MKEIHLWGVQQNNLKNIEIKIPLGSFTVLCGPSGSGKSSLAFETLYAEGQRRYTESLSNYTKQYLNKAPKPKIEGLSDIPPALSIEQKNGVKSSRSTVGTVSEIIDYFRLLYEKIGIAICPHHHIPLTKESIAEGTEKILSLFQGERGYLLAPIGKEQRLLSGKKLHQQLIKDGILRLYCPHPEKKKSTPTFSTSPSPFETGPIGEVIDIHDSRWKRSGIPKDEIYLVIDRLTFREEEKGRIADSLSQTYSSSLRYNNGLYSGQALVVTTNGHHLFISENLSCSICRYSFPPLTSRMFSFNSPVGACTTCNGFGNILELDPQKVIPNPQLSLLNGAISPFAMPSAKRDFRALLNFCKKMKINILSPWTELPQEQRQLIWEGNSDFYGVKGLFDFLETKKYKMHVRVFLSRFKSPVLCSNCHGTRLKPEVQQVRISGKSLPEWSQLSIHSIISEISQIHFTPQQQQICKELISQLTARLSYLQDVGLGYLTLDRPTRTLSGGEFQRLNLANQLGMGLSQTLYVLDEPTVGLHPRDNERLINILKKIQQQGNTLVVVEHDSDVIRNAHQIIEMGPGSGPYGGEILFSGPTAQFFQFEKSNTLPYLLGQKNWQRTNADPRPIDMESYRYKIELTQCSGHNLKSVDLAIPLHRLVSITGVSGSGKSSLITHTLYPALAKKLELEFIPSLPFKKLKGAEWVQDLLLIDQSSLAKTERSSPITYLKIFDSIRTLFAQTPDAKIKGLTPGFFSLNVDGGRCPVCKGLGYETIDMMFMDDLQITCDTCDGKKYRPEVFEIKYKSKHIGQVLEMTVEEAIHFFVAHPHIRKPLSLLREVGLEYLRLGQNAQSLSGGESQRLKLARELSGKDQKSTLYILDEPTTGLHFREVHLLLGVLHQLVESGASVIVIEHNLEIIRHSDWVIDLGPEAGEKGGYILSASTPEELTQFPQSHTGTYLRDYLKQQSPLTGDSNSHENSL